MKTSSVLRQACAALAVVLITPGASASVIFDDFNIDEGHFNLAPGFSATSVGEDATSTADRITSDSIEGAGSQKLTLVHDATATALRIRHLSGGGTVASNVSFTTSAGVDGFIGFYLKTTATGWQTSINLDGAGGTGAEMDASPSVPIIADGLWHLYEFDLDALSGWGAVPGIAGGHAGVVPNGAHTIDSIYFRDLDGTPGPTADIFLDFVAKSDSGSIASLIPEPSAAALLALGLLGLAGRRRIS